MLHDNVFAPMPRSLKAMLFELLVAVLIVLPGASIYVVKQHKRKIRDQHEEIEMKELLLGQREEELESIRDSWRIAWSELTVVKQVGKGAAGVVSLAGWLGNRVAVKEIFNETEINEASFSREAEVMQSLRHPNILCFYGAGTTPRLTPFVVIEFAEHGSLFSLLEGRFNELGWKQKRRFAADIVAGMTYLHGEP
jgi:serine/threonine protein kinase